MTDNLVELLESAIWDGIYAEDGMLCTGYANRKDEVINGYVDMAAVARHVAAAIRAAGESRTEYRARYPAIDSCSVVYRSREDVEGHIARWGAHGQIVQRREVFTLFGEWRDEEADD